jgi:hypothetical protein
MKMISPFKMNDSTDPRLSINGSESKLLKKGNKHLMSTQMLITRQDEPLSDDSENLSEVDEEFVLKNFQGKMEQHFMSETLD